MKDILASAPTVEPVTPSLHVTDAVTEDVMTGATISDLAHDASLSTSTVRRRLNRVASTLTSVREHYGTGGMMDAVETCRLSSVLRSERCEGVGLRVGMDSYELVVSKDALGLCVSALYNGVVMLTMRRPNKINWRYEQAISKNSEVKDKLLSMCRMVEAHLPDGAPAQPPAAKVEDPSYVPYRRPCACGCGGHPKGKKAKYLPGHDSRMHKR